MERGKSILDRESHMSLGLDSRKGIAHLRGRKKFLWRGVESSTETRQRGGLRPMQQHSRPGSADDRLGSGL